MLRKGENLRRDWKRDPKIPANRRKKAKRIYSIEWRINPSVNYSFFKWLNKDWKEKPGRYRSEKARDRELERLQKTTDTYYKKFEYRKGPDHK